MASYRTIDMLKVYNFFGMSETRRAKRRKRKLGSKPAL